MGEYLGSGVMLLGRVKRGRGEWVKVGKVWRVGKCVGEK